ncbi:MAG: hypothetical protein EOO39_47575 [Cytophagaceae bacterium]|nr:MAG: hypothetical protein EOO39_47575 [Cytophagaceae bacterium]
MKRQLIISSLRAKGNLGNFVSISDRLNVSGRKVDRSLARNRPVHSMLGLPIDRGAALRSRHRDQPGLAWQEASAFGWEVGAEYSDQAQASIDDR